MQKHEYYKLGSFELTSETIRVSDPCYDRDVWCCGTIPDCVPGQWDAAVVYRDNALGHHVAMLCAKSREVKSFDIFNDISIGSYYYTATKPWEMCNIDVSVNSEQCVIFDEAHYLDNNDFVGIPNSASSDGEAFYNFCRAATLNENQAGVLPHGVVSCSGYGDGSYRAFIRKNEDGKVCAIAVSYI